MLCVLYLREAERLLPKPLRPKTDIMHLQIALEAAFLGEGGELSFLLLRRRARRSEQLQQQLLATKAKAQGALLAAAVVAA